MCTRLVLLVALTLAAVSAPQPSRLMAAGADTAGVPADADTAGVPAVGRVWPVRVRPRVLRGWEPPATPYGRGHRGVDLAAAPGAQVRAVAAGRVSFAGRVAGRGVVSLELTATGEPPLRTTYEPVHATVAEGTEVAAGEPLGTLEPTNSHCTTPCLHWGLRRADTYLNPWPSSPGPPGPSPTETPPGPRPIATSPCP
ncbi:hypothetical protein SHKM778_20860 [Streptomyces sp. KM77-8]|uniref:M23ase beta-sheet core domain-containing protein n=1 Tax=Streptomyces haneummycinicus TaxID=3074435 RepID=A0AAT9HE64_9ACTN